MRAAQEKRLDDMFEHVDTNKDGKLSKDELHKGKEEMRKKMKARFKRDRAAKSAE